MFVYSSTNLENIKEMMTLICDPGVPRSASPFQFQLEIEDIKTKEGEGATISN